MSSTDHTARPMSWQTLTRWAASQHPDGDCILELRARVERLEQAQHAQPAGGLVEPEITGRELTRIWNDNEDPNEDAGDAMARLYTAGFHAGMKWQAEMMEQAQQQPEPEPADGQTLHTVALRMVDTLANLDVLPDITETIRKAIREPMAPPVPSTPAGKGELVRSVALAIPNGSTHVDWTPEARRAILAVAHWLIGKGYVHAADLLREEVGR